MELFLSRQNDQIAPVLDTCGWRCSVTPLRRVKCSGGGQKGNLGKYKGKSKGVNVEN